MPTLAHGLEKPSGFLVVFEKPNRSSFTFTFTSCAPRPSYRYISEDFNGLKLHPVDVFTVDPVRGGRCTAQVRGCIWLR
jgi:hypothetical protein